jgi:hypothetical protein
VLFRSKLRRHQHQYDCFTEQAHRKDSHRLSLRSFELRVSLALRKLSTAYDFAISVIRKSHDGKQHLVHHHVVRAAEIRASRLQHFADRIDLT